MAYYSSSQIGSARIPIAPVNYRPFITLAIDELDVTLRHSAAVAWLEAGVLIKAVADLLGHSSIAVTGDIYGHTSDATTRVTIEGLD